MLVWFNWPGLCWLSEKLVQRTATKAIHLRSCTAHLAFVNTQPHAMLPKAAASRGCVLPFPPLGPALGPAWPPPFPAALLFRAPRGAPGCLGSSSWEQQVCREAWRLPRLRMIWACRKWHNYPEALMKQQPLRRTLGPGASRTEGNRCTVRATVHLVIVTGRWTPSQDGKENPLTLMWLPAF